MQPVSLSPLNDSLQLVLPAPWLSVLCAGGAVTQQYTLEDGPLISNISDDGVGQERASASLDTPATITISLYYTLPYLSPWDVMFITLVWVTLVACCHFLAITRLKVTVDRRAKVDCSLLVNALKANRLIKNLAQIIQERIAHGEDNVSMTNGLSSHSTTGKANSDTPATPFRFKASATRKRFAGQKPGTGRSAVEF